MKNIVVTPADLNARSEAELIKRHVCSEKREQAESLLWWLNSFNDSSDVKANNLETLVYGVMTAVKYGSMVIDEDDREDYAQMCEFLLDPLNTNRQEVLKSCLRRRVARYTEYETYNNELRETGHPRFWTKEFQKRVDDFLANKPPNARPRLERTLIRRLVWKCPQYDLKEFNKNFDEEAISLAIRMAYS